MEYLVIVFLIIAFAGLFYKYPQSILPLLIFAVPLQRYNFYMESIGLSVKLIIILIPATYLALFFKRKLTFPNKAFVIFSSLLLVGAILSLVNSINVFRTISVIAFSFLSLSCAYLFTILIKTKEDMQRALSYLLIIGTIVSLLGLWQFFRFNQGKSISIPFENTFNSKTIEAEAFEFNVGETSYLRPSSTFVDVNLTAGFLTIIVLLNLAFLIEHLGRKSWDQRSLILLLLFIINASAFLLTVSRSGYLGLAVGGLIFFLINIKSFFNRRVLMALASLLTFAIILVYLVDTPIDAMWGRFQDTFLRHDITGSTQEHELFSRSAYEIFKKNTLFGIGAGNFEQYYLTNVDVTEDTAYTYNVYLGFLSEMGFIGFLGQMLFMIYVIYSSFKSLLKIENHEYKLYHSALLGSFIAILVANFFYAYYILFFVWMLIGFLLIFASNKNLHGNGKED